MTNLFRLAIAIILIAALPCISFSQSVSINTDGSTADASAMLDIKSTTKGLLIPRMSRTERNAITTPATGLIIYQNAPDSVGLYYYNGAAWVWMFSSSNTDSLAWKTGGNTGTNPLNNFLGTKDNNGLSIKTNNTEAMYVGANGSIGMGTNTPGTGLAQYAKLDLRDETGAKSDFYQFTAGSLGGYPLHAFVKQRGTLAVPAAIVPNEVLAAISAIAHNGSAYVTAGSIVFQNDGVITTTKAPGLISFNTSDTGSNTIVQRMVIKGTGNIGVGVSAPVAKFDVAGSAGGTNSVLLRSGNVSNGTASNQLTFGYNGTAQYRHSIKTRHNAGSRIGNAFDFYLWQQGVNSLDTLGSEVAMTLDGNYRGMLGIGTTAPKSEVHISDGSSSLKAVTDASGYGASMLITDNAIPRIYFEAAAQPANKKLMDIDQINQSIRFNSLTDDGGAADKSDILVVNRDGFVGVNVATPVTALDVNGSATIGTGNTNTGTRTIVSGNGNNLSGSNSVVSGLNNTVTADRSLVAGWNNTVAGENNLIGGVGNSIVGGFGHSIIVGNTNVLTGSASAVFGYLNNVNGFTTFAMGDRNTVNAQNGSAFGYQNGVQGVGGFVTGTLDTTVGTYASAFGISNRAASYSEVAMGMYGTNYTATAAGAYDANDRIFNVGNGTGTGSRSDALTILKSGNVGIGTASPSALLDVNSNKIRIRTAKTPTSSTDTGNTGDIAWDSNFMYVCVATNTWKRVAIATW